MSSVFDTYFPVPDFLRMPLVGVSITDTAITYTEISRKRSEIHVEKIQTLEVSEGVISKGVIHDQSALSTYIQSIAQSASAKHVALAVPEDIIYTFTLTIPKVDAKEISAAIEFQIEEHIPLPARDLIFDFDILDEGAFKQTIKVSAIEKKHYDAYHQLFEDVGMVLAHVESDIESVARITNLSDASCMFVLAYPHVLRLGICKDGNLVSTTSQYIEGDIPITADHACRHIQQFVAYDKLLSNKEREKTFGVCVMGEKSLQQEIIPCMKENMSASVEGGELIHEMTTGDTVEILSRGAHEMTALGVAYSSLVYD